MRRKAVEWRREEGGGKLFLNDECVRDVGG